MVGAGVLGLPFAMKYLLWPAGTVLMIFSWVTTIYTLWQVASQPCDFADFIEAANLSLDCAFLGRCVPCTKSKATDSTGDLHPDPEIREPQLEPSQSGAVCLCHSLCHCCLPAVALPQVTAPV